MPNSDVRRGPSKQCRGLARQCKTSLAVPCQRAARSWQLRRKNKGTDPMEHKYRGDNSCFSSILDLFSLNWVSLIQHFPEVPNKTGCTFHFSINCPHQYPALKDANGSFATEFRRVGVDEYSDLWEHQEPAWLLAHSPALCVFRRDH